MAAPAPIVLLGDIGATNARFALLTDGTVGPLTWIEVARYPRFDEAVTHLLQAQYRGTRVTGAVLAVAGPIEGGRSILTNSGWIVDARELRERFGFAAARVVNDFEATARSLPHLLTEDVRAIGGGSAVAGAPMAVLGPGSGLGVAALLTDGTRRIVAAGEGGHASLAAGSRREDAVIDLLRQRFGHVSAERALSGPGLENLYRAIAALDGTDAPQRNAADITQHALQGSCATSRATLDMFCALLGSVAGNLALTFAARGGVFVAGGIAPRIVDYLAASEFRRRFVEKGRFRAWLDAIPSRVIVHPAATFLGLKALAGDPVQ
jgi:glucokinase